MSTYFNSAEDTLITEARALLELHKHGVLNSQSYKEFERDVQPDQNGMYKAQDVLIWLGY